MHVVGLAGELDELNVEVVADGPHDLFQACEVPVGKDVMPAPRDEHQVRVQQRARSCRSATVGCACAAPVRLPPEPEPGSADRPREGVRLCPSGVQRRRRRPPGRPRGWGAIPDRRRPVEGAHRGEANPGTGVAGRGLGRRPATGVGGRQHRVPELLRLGEGHPEGPPVGAPRFRSKRDRAQSIRFTRWRPGSRSPPPGGCGCPGSGDLPVRWSRNLRHATVGRS